MGNSCYNTSSYVVDSPAPKHKATLNNNSTRARIKMVIIGNGCGTGLPNIGNTCFMNAALQWLFSSPGFNEPFISGNYKKSINENSKTQGQMAHAYAQLVRAIYDGRVEEIKLENFKSEVVNVNSQFKGYNQQDAFEFLLSVLNELSDCLYVHAATDKQTIAWCIGSSDSVGAEKAMEELNFREGSNVLDTFGGMVDYITKYINCECLHQNYEKLFGIMLDLPERDNYYKSVSIDQLLKGYFESYWEEAAGGRCKDCNKKSAFVKTGRITHLPKLLMIYFNRFSFGEKNKINVEIPNSLNLSSLVSEECNDLNPKEYNLYGVVNHSGNLEIGHYTADTKSIHNPSQWVTCDDERIRPIRTPTISGEDPIIVFYKRKDSQDEVIEDNYLY